MKQFYMLVEFDLRAMQKFSASDKLVLRKIRFLPIYQYYIKVWLKIIQAINDREYLPQQFLAFVLYLSISEGLR